MSVLVAMSGGVDSSVAAALLCEQGHEVVGVTLKLWGGAADRGCCSLSDVDDARRVADRLGIDHHVFNFGDEFGRHVVDPYVEAHARGLTPNPCIECNRHLKFDALVRRARALGFDQVATGHHARIVTAGDGRRFLARGADPAKDQSYVLYMLDRPTLGVVTFPVGEMTKVAVREHAARLGLRTAAKADSQEVCFIGSAEGRARFLGERIPLEPGRVVDAAGHEIGQVAAVQLVTIGQRKGLGLPGGTDPRFVLDVDVAGRTVTVGAAADLAVEEIPLRDVLLVDDVGPDRPITVQVSAHGEPAAARLEGETIRWERPRRRVAPGQAVVFYDGDRVLGGGLAR